MLGWLSVLGAALARLLRRPEDVARVVEAGNELVEAVRAGTTEPPQGPLPRRHEDHIRSQIDSATSHKVERPQAPPAGPSTVDQLTPEETDELLGKMIATPKPQPDSDGPTVAKAVDREAKTPPARPPRVPRKDPKR